MNIETELLNVLKYTNDNEKNILSKQIDILEHKINGNTNDILGTSENEVKGLQYILNKHKNILCTYIPDKSYKTFLITWTCEVIGKFNKRTLNIDKKIISYLSNCIKNKDIKYAAVLLSVNYNTCKSNEKIRAHANLLIYNKSSNTIERFDPVGGFRKASTVLHIIHKLYYLLINSFRIY